VLADATMEAATDSTGTWVPLALQGIIAVATAGAALAAWLAARASRLTGRSRAFTELFARYAKPEMADNLRLLRDWRERTAREGIEDWSGEWARALHDPSHNLHKRAHEVHKARREVLYYFVTCWYLWKNKTLNTRLFNLLVNTETAELFVKVAVPLTREWGQRSRFDSVMEGIARRVRFDPEDPLSLPIPNIDPLKQD